MSRHTQDTKCPSCEDKLDGCDPRWRPIFYLVKEEFPDVHIACGFRNEFEQNGVYKLGLSERMWPYSEHNVMKDGKPCSKALDLFRLLDLGQAEFKKSFYLSIAQFLNKLNSKIKWSGEWKKFKEYCHFQLEDSGNE